MHYQNNFNNLKKINLKFFFVVEKMHSSSNSDVISVVLVPQKKGIFLKHSEYEVRNFINFTNGD